MPVPEPVRVHQKKVHHGERHRQPASRTCLDHHCGGQRSGGKCQTRHQPQNTTGMHLNLVFKEQTCYMKGGSYMGLQCWDKAARRNRQWCQCLVLIASNSEVTFAWHTFLEGDFVLCVCGTWDCVVLVLLMVAAFAPRSFLHIFLSTYLPFENGGLLWSRH